MPSISDIPEDLLPIDKREDFLIWLKEIPVSMAIKKILLSLWAEFNHTSFSATDYDLIVGKDW